MKLFHRIKRQMQNTKEPTPADRERIAQAAQLFTRATGSGITEETVMKAVSGGSPMVPDPIELVPTPWLLRYHWMQPRRMVRELFRRAWED